MCISTVFGIGSLAFLDFSLPLSSWFDVAFGAVAVVWLALVADTELEVELLVVVAAVVAPVDVAFVSNLRAEGVT